MKNTQLALITGATSALGKALALQLAELRIPLFITAPVPSNLEALHAVLEKKVPTLSFACDLTRSEERKSLIEKIHLHAPDLVINNAGCGFYGECLIHSTEETLKILQLNCEALLEITLESARTLYASRKKGTILNISSAASLVSYPTFCVYAASKAFVNQFSLAFDHEMRPFGIRILSCLPGPIDTEFRNKASKNHPHTKSAYALSVDTVISGILKQIEKKQPFKIIDWRYSLGLSFFSLLPKRLRMRILKRGIQERYPKKDFLLTTKP